MSMIKLRKLSWCVPTKRVNRISLTNKENILFAFLGTETQVRTKAYFKYKYAEAVENLINKQVQAEQQAAQDYLGMAVSFLHPQLSRPGAGGFFMKMYEEEIGHMQYFLQYQILRGGVPQVCAIKEAKVDLSLTLCEAFTKALEMEKLVTELLENIVKAAETANDYQCADFVTTVFISEQMKSLNEMSQHVTKLSRLGEEHALYHFDLELARTHPFEYKIKL